ncbi:MAG: AI-2E family transporter [Bdellovibrionales bacterium]|nr:AI-2E family transporter [Bdellovibrionales bacterium]
MEEAEIKYRFAGLKLLVGLASVMIVAAGLREAQAVFVPILFSFFLAMLGTPGTRYLNKRIGLPKVFAVLIVAAVIIAGLVAIGNLFYGSIQEFRTALPKYSGNLNALADRLDNQLKDFGLNYSTQMLLDSLGPDAVVDVVSGTLKGLVGALSVLVVVLVAMIFMLYEATDFKSKLRIAMGEAFQPSRFESVSTDVQRYVGIKTVTSLITGISVGLLNYIMGVDFWLLWGLIAYILNYIPFVGSIIASIPAIILGFMIGGPGTGVTLIIAYTAINNGISNFLEPVMLGPRLGLSPLVVFLSLIIWGWIWGPGGALLSVPLTMILKILLEHSEEFHWVAILMNNRVVVAKKKAASEDPQPA